MKKYIFIVFPYIKSSQSMDLFGLKLWTNDDLKSIPKEPRQHLNTLLKMFYLRDNLKLTNMIFTYKEYKTYDEKIDYLIEVNKAHKLITYIYSAPHPTNLNPFIDKEHMDYYVFECGRISKSLIIPTQYVKECGKNNYPKLDPTNHFQGYNVLLNGNKSFYAIKGSKIYPVTSYLGIRYYQDLYNDFHFSKSKILDLCKRIHDAKIFKNTEIANRIFNALRWYNLSLSSLADEDMKILNIAIALETLLALEGKESVTQRFKDAIKLLVGQIEGLDIWLEQLYNIRSNIVHEGYLKEPERIMFCKEDKNKDKKKDKIGAIYYRPLVSYGRVIFSICFNAILSGLEMTYGTNLPELFKSNRERFKELCIFLDKKQNLNKSEINKIESDISEIEKYLYIPEENTNNINISEILSCIRNMGKFILKDGTAPEELMPHMKELANKVPNREDAEKYYVYISSIFEITNYRIYNKNLNFDNKLLIIFLNLIDIASKYLMNEYFSIGAQLKKENINKKKL